MKILGGFLITISLATGGFAQYRGGFNSQPFVTGSFPNVVFPGGTAAIGGVTRSFGNVVYPGGGGPRLVVPNSFSDPTRLGGGYIGRSPATGYVPGRRSRPVAIGYPYAVPVYVGGGYDGAPPPEEALPPQQQPPNVIVIYANPPQQQPVIVQGTTPAPQAVQPTAESDTSSEQPHYLLAFKDHTIYSAVAYWVEGDTLHYFTNGNTHNQVSLSLIDRDLTERLNRETGADIRLPR
jgi:hypothetical protein